MKKTQLGASILSILVWSAAAWAQQEESSPRLDLTVGESLRSDIDCRIELGFGRLISGDARSGGRRLSLDGDLRFDKGGNNGGGSLGLEMSFAIPQVGAVRGLWTFEDYKGREQLDSEVTFARKTFVAGSVVDSAIFKSTTMLLFERSLRAQDGWDLLGEVGMAHLATAMAIEGAETHLDQLVPVVGLRTGFREGWFFGDAAITGGMIRRGEDEGRLARLDLEVGAKFGPWTISLGFQATGWAVEDDDFQLDAVGHEFTLSTGLAF
ncbi:MAG: hypothetical protein HYY16_05010 [Planctomycetes bacterium]|nr:hypothetical protein [Planctomycetota bacterium]